MKQEMQEAISDKDATPHIDINVVGSQERKAGAGHNWALNNSNNNINNKTFPAFGDKYHRLSTMREWRLYINEIHQS